MTTSASVIVCTYGRDELEDTIKSLITQKIPKSLSFEIIIVDNSPNDKLGEEITKPKNLVDTHIRYIFEKNAGLSRARNIGVKNATGKIVAYVDDDAIADEEWLYELTRLYKDKDVACVGGKIEPLWMSKKPGWYSDILGCNLSLLDYGSTIKECHFPNYPYGCNMSFRKDIFDQVGGFDTTLGRKQFTLLSGEEPELQFKIEKKGYKILYNPKAVVYHKIESSRLNKKFFEERVFCGGISDIKLHRKTLGVKYVTRTVLYLILITPFTLLRYIYYSVRKDEVNSFSHKLRIISNLGYISSALKLK